MTSVRICLTSSPPLTVPTTSKPPALRSQARTSDGKPSESSQMSTRMVGTAAKTMR